MRTYCVLVGETPSSGFYQWFERASSPRTAINRALDGFFRKVDQQRRDGDRPQPTRPGESDHPAQALAVYLRRATAEEIQRDQDRCKHRWQVRRARKGATHEECAWCGKQQPHAEATP